MRLVFHYQTIAPQNPAVDRPDVGQKRQARVQRFPPTPFRVVVIRSRPLGMVRLPAHHRRRLDCRSFRLPAPVLLR